MCKCSKHEEFITFFLFQVEIVKGRLISPELFKINFLGVQSFTKCLKINLKLVGLKTQQRKQYKQGENKRKISVGRSSVGAFLRLVRGRFPGEAGEGRPVPHRGFGTSREGKGLSCNGENLTNVYKMVLRKKRNKCREEPARGPKELEQQCPGLSSFQVFSALFTDHCFATT